MHFYHFRYGCCIIFCHSFFFFFNALVSRTSPEFQKLLGIAMEMFLLCSDDGESDVRMVADECLNKIIKVSRTRCSYSHV